MEILKNIGIFVVVMILVVGAVGFAMKSLSSLND